MNQNNNYSFDLERKLGLQSRFLELINKARKHASSRRNENFTLKTMSINRIHDNRAYDKASTGELSQIDPRDALY